MKLFWYRLEQIHGAFSFISAYFLIFIFFLLKLFWSFACFWDQTGNAVFVQTIPVFRE